MGVVTHAAMMYILSQCYDGSHVQSLREAEEDIRKRVSEDTTFDL